MKSVALEYKIWWLFKYQKWQEDLYGKKLLDGKACSLVLCLGKAVTFLFAHFIQCYKRLLFYYIAKVEISIFSNLHDTRAISLLMLTANLHLTNTSVIATCRWHYKVDWQRKSLVVPGASEELCITTTWFRHLFKEWAWENNLKRGLQFFYISISLLEKCQEYVKNDMYKLLSTCLSLCGFICNFFGRRSESSCNALMCTIANKNMLILDWVWHGRVHPS